MMAKYVDDKIEYIEQDTLKIRTRPSMYISYKGSKGALHLAKEVINNAIDECINKNSPGDSILIVFDEKENKLTVMDNGRGIPLDKVELVCTKIQAGSKLYREADKQGVENKSFTAGENGVGITAVNALSELFQFDICHNGNKGTFVFNEGKLVRKNIAELKPIINPLPCISSVCCPETVIKSMSRSASAVACHNISLALAVYAVSEHSFVIFNCFLRNSIMSCKFA